MLNFDAIRNVIYSGVDLAVKSEEEKKHHNFKLPSQKDLDDVFNAIKNCKHITRLRLKSVVHMGTPLLNRCTVILSEQGKINEVFGTSVKNKPKFNYSVAE